MRSYYVYILHCSDGTYYTGVTNNLGRRLMEPQYGLNPDAYTFSRRPFKLVFHEQYNDITLAIRTEKKIQKWSAKKKAALAKGDWDRIKDLAECRNLSHSKYQGLDSARPDNKGEACLDYKGEARPDLEGEN